MTADTKNTNGNNKSLDKKILSVTHQLQAYVKQRLKIAENTGIVPKNMYSSNGVIDEVVLKMYEKNIDESIDLSELRLMMFSEVNKKLKTLFDSEKWHQKAFSTRLILEEEMKQLEENFTVDGDMDLIMNEELDDISYHQDDHDEDIYVLSSEETQQGVADFLELKDRNLLADKEKQMTLRRMYRKLPMQTSNVVDLYILGKLNMQEISQIMEIEIVEVKRILDFIKENFKKYLI